MLYTLPQPVAGQTHAQIGYIEIRPDKSIELAGFLGTLDEKGAFVALDSYGGLSFLRTIAGDEFAAFNVEGAKQGSPITAFGALLFAWLDGTGLDKSRFVAKVDAGAAVAAVAAEEVLP